jgi:hypothetical protein
MDRRTWLQLLSVLSAARAGHSQQRGGTPPGATPPAGRGQQQPPPLRITKEQVVAGLALIGLQYRDAEVDMMLRRVNNSLTRFEMVRKIDIPLGVEPSFAFCPGLPNRTPIKGPQRFQTTIARTAAKSPANLDEVAFWPVTELAPLIRSRAVSSTELTKMYLGRMKKYGPKLLCLVTLTEDLALEQAAAADKQIRAGRYKGPLHGIPFGLKDLFDTKSILHVRRRALSKARRRSRRYRSGAVAQRRRGADRQAIDGRARPRRPVVPGTP